MPKKLSLPAYDPFSPVIAQTYKPELNCCKDACARK